MYKIGFIGSGNMAEALLKGALNLTRDVIMSDPLEERLSELKRKYGVAATVRNEEAAALSEIVVLAVKPQAAENALKSLMQCAHNPLYISIMAGIPTSALEMMLPNNARVIRAMPNAPALVLKGVTLLCRGLNAADEDMRRAEELFRCAGSVINLKEELMDAATGISGCGPAYFYLIIESLSDAGVRAGLKRDDALIMAAQTAAGAAQMVLETGLHPAALKDMVTSPAGATAEALKTLEKKGVRGIVMQAVEAAIKRAKSLANKR